MVEKRTNATTQLPSQPKGDEESKEPQSQLMMHGSLE
jgi:hypothetical protein